MLNISHLNVTYGPIPALSDGTFTVGDGKIVAVLGANGAGKTSLLRAISGVARDVQGLIEFDGHVIMRRGLGQRKISIRHLQPHHIVKLGVVQVPEGRQVFPQLTVLENLKLGAYVWNDSKVATDLDRVMTYFPVLKEKRGRLATTLSGGEQQMLAIARGLMARPKLLMLDEPSIGLSPKLVQETFSILRTINQQEGCAILIVEQDVRAALGIAQYAYVLETPGHIAVEGTSAELSENRAVQKAYLGA